LEDCQKLEEVIKKLTSSRINFEDKEELVNAKDGIEKLLEIAKKSKNDQGSAAPLIKCIVNVFMDALAGKIEKDIKVLESQSSNVKNAIEELKKVSENLKKNFWEYPKAIKFIGITEEDIERIVSEQMKMDSVYTLKELENEVNERKEYLRNISENLETLNSKLENLKEIFNQIKGVA